MVLFENLFKQDVCVTRHFLSFFVGLTTITSSDKKQLIKLYPFREGPSTARREHIVLWAYSYNAARHTAAIAAGCRPYNITNTYQQTPRCHPGQSLSTSRQFCRTILRDRSSPQVLRSGLPKMEQLTNWEEAFVASMSAANGREQPRD